MTKEELINLYIKIRNVEATSEEQEDEWIMRFAKAIPDPEPLKYFSVNQFPNKTPEEIIDIALAYKPIQLGSGDNFDGPS